MTVAPMHGLAAAPGEPRGVRHRYRVANMVVAATAVVVTLIFSLLAYLTWQAYERTLEQGEVRSRTAAAMLTTRAQWIIGTNLSILDGVARDAAVLPAGALARAAPPPLRLAASGAQFELYDATGTRVAGAANAASDSIAGTDFFAALIAGEEWTVTAAQAGADPEPRVVLARAILRNGRFAGVALLRFDQRVFDIVFQLLELEEGSSVSLIKTDGQVIMRRPRPDSPVYLAGTPVFGSILASDSGSYVSERSPVDGMARIVAFQHVPQFGLIAIGAVSRDAILNQLWRSLGLVLIMLVPIAAAAIAGSVVTARLLRRSARTQQRLEAALEHNELLFHEIHHRVKNNLQSVSSLLQMQPIAREVKLDMCQRIAAMAAIHEQIYSSSNFETVEMRRYLKNLLMGLKSSYESPAEVVEDLEDLEVDRETATSLGLIVNEVVSNAYKHAFPDGRPGRVSIALRRKDTGRGVLEIADDGVGITAQEGRARGIGRRLINSLSEQIGGVATYEAEDGTRFTLDFPLTAEASGKATDGARVTPP